MFTGTTNQINSQTTNTTATETSQQQTLRELVKQVCRNYIKQLDGEEPTRLYDMMLEEIEGPMLEEIMKSTRYNQSKAANWLGISRGTLRKKLKKYDLL